MAADPKNEDRRVSRTKRSLRGALLELILEKHYDAITVQEIIDRADVGRSTFYQHFRDKEDLFRGDWERLLDHFAAQFGPESLRAGRIFPVRELCEHVADFQRFYRALVRSGKTERIFSAGRRHLAETLERRIAALADENAPPAVPPALLANFLATEIFAHLKWWLDNNMPCAPAAVDAYFHRLTAAGFRAGLEPSAERPRPT